MADKEIMSLLSKLREDSVFRDKCLNAIYKKDENEVSKLLEEEGLQDLMNKPLSEIKEIEKGEGIYKWSGKYHFTKPENMKKSILLIDDIHKEVSINAHSLKVESGLISDNFSITSAKNTYNLQFKLGENDTDTNSFEGLIFTGKETQGVQTQGSADEWYETSEAQKYSMAMTIIGTFDLALGLFLLIKEYRNNKKEEPEKEKDREDIRNTHTQVEIMHSRIKNLVNKNMEIASRNELREKSKQLSDLLNQQILDSMKQKYDEILESSILNEREVDRKIALDKIKETLNQKYTDLIASELSNHATKIKERYFEPLEIEYDEKIEKDAIYEVAEKTYTELNSCELFEDYFKSFEINKELKHLELDASSQQSEKLICDKTISSLQTRLVNTKIEKDKIELKRKLNDAYKKQELLESKIKDIDKKVIDNIKRLREAKKRIDTKEVDFRRKRG